MPDLSTCRATAKGISVTKSVRESSARPASPSQFVNGENGKKRGMSTCGPRTRIHEALKDAKWYVLQSQARTENVVDTPGSEHDFEPELQRVAFGQAATFGQAASPQSAPLPPPPGIHPGTTYGYIDQMQFQLQQMQIQQMQQAHHMQLDYDLL